MSIDLTESAELLEVIAVLVDAMRRSDPDYVMTHGCEQCSDEDWDTAIEAGEDAMEMAEFLDKEQSRNSGTGSAADSAT